MKDVLQVATRGGSGSAARTLGGGLAGLFRRARRFPLLLGAFAAVSLLGWDLLSGVTTEQTSGDTAPATRDTLTSPPTATPTPEASVPPDVSGRVAYSIDLSEVAGLSPTVAPGSSVELWATWEKPVTRSPRLQRVVEDAILEKVSVPLTPDGPTVATFLITPREMDELLWADRYGAISATVPVP